MELFEITTKIDANQCFPGVRSAERASRFVCGATLGSSRAQNFEDDFRAKRRLTAVQMHLANR